MSIIYYHICHYAVVADVLQNMVPVTRVGDRDHARLYMMVVNSADDSDISFN